MEHELKIWPDYFDRILDGTKTFELRYGDRPFEVGDMLHLREWSPDSEEYTGRDIRVEVSYIMRSSDFLANEDCVCMGLKNPRITQLEQSLIFNIDDGMKSQVSLVGDPDLARLIKFVCSLHPIGTSVIGCAVELIEQGQRDALRLKDLERQLEASRELIRQCRSVIEEYESKGGAS